MVNAPSVSTEVTKQKGADGLVIEAVGLRKTFGRTVAVDHLDLAVREREIFGIVGPDGAGKTTTFRLLIGMLAPNSGKAVIGGHDVSEHTQLVRSQTGYMAQQFTLYDDLSIEENMQFVARIRNMSPQAYAERSRALLELTKLAPFVTRLGRNLSGGMRRKLMLACALLHSPRILLLDEPTTGIDPVSRREFWRMLYRLPEDGVTTLVSTPYLEEAERCHRLAFMVGGRVLAVDTPTGLLERMPDALVEIQTEARGQARRLLRNHPDVRRVETLGDMLRVAFDPQKLDAKACGELKQSLQAAGVTVERCEPVAPTLSDVFSALSERRREQPAGNSGANQ